MQATSIHIQPVKSGSEEHNQRLKELDYVRTELTYKNEYWESDTISNRLENVKSKYFQTVGQRLQSKATPIREAVVVIKEDTTMQELKDLALEFERAFKIRTFQIAIHRDEGHHKSREWKPNLHAHLVFDWTDQKTGKTLKLTKEQICQMQTITADILRMERGKSSSKKHLNAIQYKADAKRKEIEQKEVLVSKMKQEEEYLSERIEQGDELYNQLMTELELAKDELEKTQNKAILEQKRLQSISDKVSGLEKKERSLKQSVEEIKEEKERILQEADRKQKIKLEELKKKHKTWWGYDHEAMFEETWSEYRKDQDHVLIKTYVQTKKEQNSYQVLEKDRKELENKYLALKKEFNATRESTIKALTRALGKGFSNFLKDFQRLFQDLDMAVGLWMGKSWTNEQKREKYTADRQREKLLINGETIDERNTKKKNAKQKIGRGI